MAKQLKRWQGWLLFGGAMAVVFVLGLITSSLMERRAEVASIFNNRRTPMTDSIVAQNEKFKADFPREYESWAMTTDTSFTSEFNGSKATDELADRPEMVILWAGYAFSQEYTHHAATVMPSRTCATSCGQGTQALTATATCSRVRAGHAKDPTCQG